MNTFLLKEKATKEIGFLNIYQCNFKTHYSKGFCFFLNTKVLQFQSVLNPANVQTFADTCVVLRQAWTTLPQHKHLTDKSPFTPIQYICQRQIHSFAGLKKNYSRTVYSCSPRQILSGWINSLGVNETHFGNCLKLSWVCHLYSCPGPTLWKRLLLV